MVIFKRHLHLQALNCLWLHYAFIYLSVLVDLNRDSHYPASFSKPQCNSIYIATADYDLIRVAYLPYPYNHYILYPCFRLVSGLGNLVYLA